MFWAEAALSFALWVGYGVWLARRGLHSARMEAWKRSTKAQVAFVALLASGVVLLGAFAAAINLDWMTPTRFTTQGWLLVTFAGFVFVHCQGLAVVLAMEASLTVTSRRPSTSTKPAAQEHTDATP